MEQNAIDAPDYGDQLIMDGLSATYLSEAAGWAKFLAIAGFVMCGIIILVGVYTTTIFARLGAIQSTETSFMSYRYLVTILYVVLGILYFMPCLYLFNFATQMKKALRMRDQSMLSQSLRNIKSCFKFMGIIMILVFGFYAVALLVGVLAKSFI